MYQITPQSSKSSLSPEFSDGLRIAVVLGTILVVIRHAFYLEPYYEDGSLWMPIHDWNCLVQRAINVFTAQAVPCFFMMSGFLFFLNLTEYRQVIRKWQTRVKSLVVPYLLWNLIWILIFYGISQIPQLREAALSQAIVLKGDGLVIWLKTFTISPALGVFWYIRTLIVFIILAPFLLLLYRRWTTTLWVLILASIRWHAVDLGIFSTEGFLFFFQGGAIAQYHLHEKMAMARSGKLLLLGWGTVIAVIVFRLFVPVQILWNANILFSVYLLILSSIWLSHTKFGAWIKKLAPHMLFLYALHIMVFFLLEELLPVLPLTPVYSFALFCLRAIVGCVVPLGISWLTLKFLPKTHGILIGGR